MIEPFEVDFEQVRNALREMGIDPDDVVKFRVDLDAVTVTKNRRDKGGGYVEGTVTTVIPVF